MNDPERDRALATRVAQGDRSAFSELMRLHEDMVFAVALRILGNRDLAFDATQETFITVFRKADRYHGASAFSTWLYRVTVNTCYDLLRRAKRRATEPLPDHHDPIDVTAGDPFLSAELRPEIEAALAQIPEDFRVAVVLSDVQGFGMNEISDILHIPAGTVKSRVFRGRRQLAAILGNREHPSGHPKDSDA